MKFIIATIPQPTGSLHVYITRCPKTYTVKQKPEQTPDYYIDWGYLVIRMHRWRDLQIEGALIPDFTNNRVINMGSITEIKTKRDARKYLYDTYGTATIPKNIFRDFKENYKNYIIPYLKKNIKL